MSLDEIRPRDALPFFDLTTETFVNLVANTATRIVLANPDRVLLLISSPSAASIYCSTKPVKNTSAGIVATATLPPLLFTAKDHYTLPQSEWWAITTVASAPLFVQEIVLARDPEQYGGYKIYAAPEPANDEQGSGPYEYVPPGVKPAPNLPDLLSPGQQQDYYKLWQACCAGRRRPTAVSGGTGGHFDSGGIWHPDTR